MKLTPKILAMVMFPVLVVMIGAGTLYDFYGRQIAEKQVDEQLRSAAQLAVELIENHLEQVDGMLSTLLAQGAVQDYVMFRLGGLLDEAEDSRLKIEESLVRLVRSHPEFARLELFDEKGQRFVAIINGKRTLTPSNVQDAKWMRAALKRGRFLSFEGGETIRLTRSMGSEEGGGDVIAAAMFDFRIPVGEAIEFATRHLDGVYAEVRCRKYLDQFHFGRAGIARNSFAAVAPIGAFEGTVTIHQSKQAALLPFHQSRQIFHNALAIISLLCLAIIGLGTRLLVMAPIHHITAMISAFQSGQPLPAPKSASKDELGIMSKTLRKALIGWRKSSSQLKELNATLEARVVDRTRAIEEHQRDLEEVNQELGQMNEALQEATQQAQAAADAKTEFLANMSHEIRTPMTAILGFTDVLLEQGEEHEAPSDQMLAIQTVKRNGEHLLTIINDILDISKIESGKLEVERIPLSPIEIVSDVVSLMKVRAEAKELSLEAEYAGAIPETIQSDPTRLRQILLNLVGNAIKFTAIGSVRIVTRVIRDNPADPMMQFDIIDTGIGMKDEQISQLFQPFVQADSSTTRKFGGTGLGLTISKRLAEMLGGGIHVTCKLDQGCCFQATVQTGPLDEVRMIDHSIALPPYDKADAPAPATRPSTLSCRVLLAEDGPDNQRLISLVLKKAGAQVTVADNGQVAVDLVLSADEGDPDASGFDVILMDMQMPVLDGYGATRLLRAKGYTGPIIALTAHAMAGDREKCIEAGCDDYTTKPIDRKKMIAMIAKITGQRNESTASV